MFLILKVKRKKVKEKSDAVPISRRGRKDNKSILHVTWVLFLVPN